MQPDTEIMKIKKRLPKLTLKKATENAGKSDNRQIFATLLAKQAMEKIPQN